MSLTKLTKLAWLALLTTCAAFDPDNPPNIKGAYEVKPDSLMIAEYHKAEACTGVKGDISQVHWYFVPDTFPDPDTGAPDIGWTDIDNHGIYLAVPWKTYGWMWKHESIHEITGIRGHPETPFGIPCQALWGYINQNGD